MCGLLFAEQNLLMYLHFESNCAVAMLAVAEHMLLSCQLARLRDVHEVLKANQPTAVAVSFVHLLEKQNISQTRCCTAYVTLSTQFYVET